MSSNNQSLVPQARQALDRFKMEAASEVGVNLKQGYNGDITARQAGSIGGQMVKKMISQYENNLASGSNGSMLMRAPERELSFFGNNPQQLSLRESDFFNHIYSSDQQENTAEALPYLTVQKYQL